MAMDALAMLAKSYSEPPSFDTSLPLLQPDDQNLEHHQPSPIRVEEVKQKGDSPAKTEELHISEEEEDPK
ncbi:hypothetical protein SESBI_30757 [Sesbania bispinosa]|nr:hypothetical protein SESBI_30757 [Sesbania bispinosa]